MIDHFFEELFVTRQNNAIKLLLRRTLVRLNIIRHLATRYTAQKQMHTHQEKNYYRLL